MPFYALNFNNGIVKTMTHSSDTLIKAIFEVFSRIFTPIDGYSGDSLPNSIFEFIQGVRTIFRNIFLQVAPQEEVENAQIE